MGSPTIIVVDDNYLFQDATCQLLVFDYPDVIATDSAATALKWVKNANPELVITDVCFPQDNGFQLLREIRKVSATTKVLLLTGYRDLLYLREGIRLGLSGYVVKQYAGTELNPAVHCVLSGGLYVSPSLYRQPGFSQPFKVGDSIRRQDVLQLSRKEFSTREIASILKVNPRTIAHYRHTVLL